MSLLAVDRLCVDLRGAAGSLRIVDGVGFAVAPAERLALVGESGSGKSVTARAIMRLDTRAVVSGAIRFDGADLLALPERRMRALRGAGIGMVFQDPMTALDPLMTIGEQVGETLRIRGVPRRMARVLALKILDDLGVARAGERLDEYPHAFSGGMRQRVVLAMALIGEPKLLIADEPTTALDARVQQQVLDMLDAISRARGLAVLLITHDLGVVADFADRVMVMYAGRIVEDAPMETLFARPAHPYTKGLLAAVPRIDRTKDSLAAIPGAPPKPANRPPGCAFHPRCPERRAVCETIVPPLVTMADRRVACHAVA